MDTANLLSISGGSGEHQREIICIEVKKICDFCFQEHRVERTFEAGSSSHHKKFHCKIDEENIVCREVERRDHHGHKGKVLVCLAIEVPVILGSGKEKMIRRVVFLKQAVLCAPEGTEIECKVTGNCCCFHDTTSHLINCVFDFCVVIQSKVTVRVLIPTFGECMPKPCKSTAQRCPPKSPKDCCREEEDESGDCDCF